MHPSGTRPARAGMGALLVLAAVLIITACTAPTSPPLEDDGGTAEENTDDPGGATPGDDPAGTPDAPSDPDPTDPADPADPDPSDPDPSDPDPGDPADPDDPGTPSEPNSQSITLDFQSATDGYVAAAFAAGGLAAEPSEGLLDSDGWQISGMSDGEFSFGEEALKGDFARGPSTGGVSTGGLYAFSVADGNTALGIQPTGTDFAPGSLTIRMPVTIPTVSKAEVEFALWWLNDQNRSSRWDLSFSADGELWYDVEPVGIATPAAADSQPEWTSVERILTIEMDNLDVDSGDTLYLRWTCTDGEGSGSRDEFGLDDLSIVLHPTP